MAIGAILGALGAGLLGTAGSAAGSAITAQSNYLENAKDRALTVSENALNREFSALEAQKQRDYEERLANSQYQRAVADLEAAGINVASLSGSSVSGASVPSGASASSAGAIGAGAHSGSNFSFGSNMFNSAINAMLAKDKDAAKFVASAVVDNAKDAHKVEELNEDKELQKAIKEAREGAVIKNQWRTWKDQNGVDWAKKI